MKLENLSQFQQAIRTVWIRVVEIQVNSLSYFHSTVKFTAWCHELILFRTMNRSESASTIHNEYEHWILSNFLYNLICCFLSPTLHSVAVSSQNFNSSGRRVCVEWENCTMQRARSCDWNAVNFRDLSNKKSISRSDVRYRRVVERVTDEKHISKNFH